MINNRGTCTSTLTAATLVDVCVYNIPIYDDDFLLCKTQAQDKMALIRVKFNLPQIWLILMDLAASV